MSRETLSGRAAVIALILANLFVALETLLFRTLDSIRETRAAPVLCAARW